MTTTIKISKKVKFIQNRYTNGWVAIQGKLGFDLNAKTYEDAVIEWAAKEAKMNIELNKRIIAL